MPSRSEVPRRAIPRAFLAAVLAMAACAVTRAPAAPAEQTQPSATIPDIRLSPAFPKLTFTRPVWLTHAGDGSNRLFVIEQPGRIRVFENRSDVEKAGVFLDLRARVNDAGNEEGLLALAFHPKFSSNRQFYVYYTAANPRRGVLSRFTVKADAPDQADPASEQVILEVAQPYSNHNGSTVLFGPDGFLYISLGDGGWANDPHDHGQNMNSLLGKILRIDVDRAEGDQPYAAPPDNPFVGSPGARPEVWASGLRNVWRMSFDARTGALWAGDVGQNSWEEIDLIVKGGNYGWNLREGRHPFASKDERPGLIDPVVEYPRDQGISVTGGYVYRGSRFPALRGVYIYGDYASGRIWGLRHESGAVTAHREVLPRQSRRTYIASFGEDADGELYICSFDKIDARGTEGRVWRILTD